MNNKFQTELLECLTKVELDVIRKALGDKLNDEKVSFAFDRIEKTIESHYEMRKMLDSLVEDIGGSLLEAIKESSND